MTERRAIIFHGTGGHPYHCWYRWLGARLEARGYVVEIPHYPGLNSDPIETFLPTVLAGHSFDEETVLLLGILEHVETPVAQAILVAGYSTRPNESEEPVLQAAYDWERISANVRDITFVNSVRDPYGCDAEQGRRMFDELGGTQIIRNEGHFGDMGDPYPTFELLDKLVG